MVGYAASCLCMEIFLLNYNGVNSCRSPTLRRYGGADDEEGHIVNTHRLATNLQSDRMIGDDYGLLWLE